MIINTSWYGGFCHLYTTDAKERILCDKKGNICFRGKKLAPFDIFLMVPRLRNQLGLTKLLAVVSEISRIASGEFSAEEIQRIKRIERAKLPESEFCILLYLMLSATKSISMNYKKKHIQRSIFSLIHNRVSIKELRQSYENCSC